MASEKQKEITYILLSKSVTIGVVMRQLYPLLKDSGLKMKDILTSLDEGKLLVMTRNMDDGGKRELVQSQGETVHILQVEAFDAIVQVASLKESVHEICMPTSVLSVHDWKVALTANLNQRQTGHSA